MKPAQIFHQYIWIINTFRVFGQLTLEELNEKWVEDKVTEGNALPRSSFNRHRDAIRDMFGIDIECDKMTYKYYIGNPGVLVDGSIEQWLFSTMAVHGVLAHRLHIGYKKFQAEGYEKMVCPYALKLFRQRWYLLALNDEDQMRIYALDRMTMVELTDEAFVMPEDFSPQAYFSEYFGVLTNDTPMAHVIVRAHKWMPNYLRTLPLHHSQRELTSTEDYTDFSFDIRPTSDFLGELLRHSEGIEVLEPQDLREKMREMIENTLRRY